MEAFLDSYLVNVNTDAPSIALLVDHQSPRLKYVCDFIFNQVLRVNYCFINTSGDFEKYEGIKLNLSAQNQQAAIHIPLKRFIFETQISNHQFVLKPINGQWLLFNHDAEEKPLDIFSAIFFFISRYEEWTNQTFDAHDRFEANASILSAHNALLLPLVDIWVNQLRFDISAAFPQFPLPEKFFKVISTIDVDNVFAYRGKPLTRSVGGLLKQLMRFDFYGFFERLNCLLLNKKDPFDIYEEVSALCKSLNIPLAYFFLCKTGTTYDRSLNPNAKILAKVFNEIKAHEAGIGLHPSYHSAYYFGLLTHEKEILEKQSGNKIMYSRQHFLRFDIKSTPQILIKHGIKADFTMGFASKPGFRAGTSHPFYYYDFHSELVSELLMVPFCAMDGAYTHYEPTPAQTAFQSMLSLAESIKKVGGYFTFVYHERSFDNHLYKDYGDLYKKLLLHLK